MVLRKHIESQHASILVVAQRSDEKAKVLQLFQLPTLFAIAIQFSDFFHSVLIIYDNDIGILKWLDVKSGELRIDTKIKYSLILFLIDAKILNTFNELVNMILNYYL